jgi:EAL domain-containing protein (putative c-di-GMP-specific phosphodiesterase class I)
VTASIGIAVGSHEHLTTAEELTRNADLAMYASKSTGEGLVSFFAPSMHEKAVLRLALTSDLRRALDGGQFVVHYQPIVALDDGRIVGAEALVRWNHPQRGLIGPGARWRENPKWSRSFFMTVNVSRLQLRSSRFVADVEGVLQHAGLPPDRTVLEITESAVGDSRSDVSVRLAELKRLGVRLAVDDFGTGYSALSQLEDMPVDMLKIDKSFIDALGSAKQHDQLVDGIINLAHRMHLQTVAEGIETQEQATTLRRLGSDLGQGFHFAEPLPAEEFEALLQTPSAPDGPRQPPSPGRRRAGGRVAASTRH